VLDQFRQLFSLLGHHLRRRLKMDFVCPKIMQIYTDFS
jgi:hypothetical protein